MFELLIILIFKLESELEVWVDAGAGTDIPIIHYLSLVCVDAESYFVLFIKLIISLEVVVLMGQLLC
jgi:hypothetical protein